jgi:hypothetical protein
MYFAIIAQLIQTGAGLLGMWLDDGPAEERRLRRKALAEYSALQPPEVQDFIAREVSGSKLSDITANEEQRAIQDEASARLLQRGRGGPSLAYQAAREQAQVDAATRAAGQREAVLSDARQRGTVGSGESLFLQAQAAQDAANTERLAGVQQLADDEEQAFQAMIAAGNMAGQREEREWNQDAQVASAEDDIALFNAGQWNQAQMFNIQQRQQDFANRLALADRKAGIYAAQGQQAREDGARLANAIGAGGQNVGSVLTSIGSNSTSTTAKPVAVKQPAMTGPKGTSSGATVPVGQTLTPGAVGTNAALAPVQQTTYQTRRRAK